MPEFPSATLVSAIDRAGPQVLLNVEELDGLDQVDWVRFLAAMRSRRTNANAAVTISAGVFGSPLLPPDVASPSRPANADSVPSNCVEAAGSGRGATDAAGGTSVGVATVNSDAARASGWTSRACMGAREPTSATGSGPVTRAVAGSAVEMALAGFGAACAGLPRFFGPTSVAPAELFGPTSVAPAGLFGTACVGLGEFFGASGGKLPGLSGRDERTVERALPATGATPTAADERGTSCAGTGTEASGSSAAGAWRTGRRAVGVVARPEAWLTV